MVSIRPIFSIEANKDAENQINSNAYILNIRGESMRDDGKDLHVTAYNLTHFQGAEGYKLTDINKDKPKYQIA